MVGQGRKTNNKRRKLKMGWLGDYLLAKEESDNEEKKNQISIKIPYLKVTATIFTAVLLANLISTEISKWTVAYQLNEAAEKIAKSARERGIKLEKRLSEQRKINDTNRTANQKIIDEQRRVNEVNRMINQEIAEDRRRIKKIENERQRNANKKRTETCNFWITQYRKTNNISDKAYMEKSCEDAR
jgi:hypothetical protein